MAKNALVINGADFGTNKVTTVTFAEEVPCTAISLSESSKTVTTVTPFTLTATKTPANTTDAVYWSSSDTDVVTVNNGTVTVVGVGTATITATCGAQTATCSIDATEVEPDVDYGFFTLSKLTDDVGLRTAADLNRFTIYNADLYGHMLGFRTNDGINGCPIPLLNNVAKVKVTATSMKSDNAHCYWLDTTTPASETYSDAASLILDDNTQSTSTGSVTLTYDKPSGANAVAVQVRMSSAASSNDPELASAFATDHGIKLTFLAATT